MIRRRILIGLLVIVIGLRFIPGGGEFYALHLYPNISLVLSSIASIVPFSLEEWVIIGICMALIIIPIALRKKGWKHCCALDIEIVGWTIVWFYVGWGMNYYRDSFYVRMQCPPVKVEKKSFLAFLNSYTDSINTLYTNDISIPTNERQVKYACFNWLYNSVGVLGYMGPFFCESQLNSDLLPVQYPFVYAHEHSHLLGISNEAEANFWAYNECTRSTDPKIRYAGYYGILPNVIRNARNLLTKEEYERWIKTVSPKVIAQFESERDYWRSRYSPLLSNIQDVMFNLLLKGNRISNGTKNYDQVLEMILSFENKN